jgi:cobalt-zinc-cadmium resistance protein CzcA
LNVIERLIRSALERRTLVLSCLVIAIGAGIAAYRQLPTDVFPDLTVPVFNVITQNASMAAEELELAVTLPMESSLNGLPGVRRIRSVTQQGVSQVTVEFDSDVDYWRARQLVSERLAQVVPQLPAGTRPPLLSSLTNRLNEVFEFIVEGDANTDPMARSSICAIASSRSPASPASNASADRSVSIRSSSIPSACAHAASAWTKC